MRSWMTSHLWMVAQLWAMSFLEHLQQPKKSKASVPTLNIVKPGDKRVGFPLYTVQIQIVFLIVLL